jgi:hypothetical protein
MDCWFQIRRKRENIFQKYIILIWTRRRMDAVKSSRVIILVSAEFGTNVSETETVSIIRVDANLRNVSC